MTNNLKTNKTHVQKQPVSTKRSYSYMGKVLSRAVERLCLSFSQKSSVFAETETSKAKNSMFPDEFGNSETG